jgi:hypothetical protein
MKLPDWHERAKDFWTKQSRFEQAHPLVLKYITLTDLLVKEIQVLKGRVICPFHLERCKICNGCKALAEADEIEKEINKG